ncbi:unnamed protein product [Auanema sp. JU1783]|nr:unnamed protein product [Auanema sp. JU1783]
MTSTPCSPTVSHAPSQTNHPPTQGRQLSVTAEEGGNLILSQPPAGRKIKKIVALSGEEDMTSSPSVMPTPKSRFRNGHASFRLRMLQEQHGTGFEPKKDILHSKTMSWTSSADDSSWISSKMKEKAERHKFKPASVPTSPASGSRLDPLASADSSAGKKRQQMLYSHSTTPPGTPTSKFSVERDSFKKKLSHTMSVEKKRSASGDIIEDAGSSGGTALRAVRQFKSAHESFRLRMFQEQHGLEPVGGDLNKYTAKTYAIQNGNEVFGESLERRIGNGKPFAHQLSFRISFKKTKILGELAEVLMEEQGSNPWGKEDI